MLDRDPDDPAGEGTGRRDEGGGWDPPEVGVPCNTSPAKSSPPS